VSYELYIKGEPIAKKRPRFARRGNFVATINDQETEEGRFLFEVQKQWGLPPLNSYLSIEMFFCFTIPKSASKKKSHQMEVGEILPTKKDLDNCIKFVLDCLNGETWKDDSLITRIVANKFYGRDPFTKIIIVNFGKNENALSHIS